MSSMNRQLTYLQQLNHRHRLLVVFFEDAELKAYISRPPQARKSTTATSLPRSSSSKSGSSCPP
ncbi:putative dihydropyrimidine dehydrogenase [Bacteroides pyogenes DSM 20611 = JCM 6294]|nr:putative dihydropyrimidine dehydrogenase [Bacteroides pyogenes DSM 20611 = JCM 6294]